MLKELLEKLAVDLPAATSEAVSLQGDKDALKAINVELGSANAQLLSKNSALSAENVALKARVAELEKPPVVPPGPVPPVVPPVVPPSGAKLLFADNFTKLPDSQRYVIEADGGAGSFSVADNALTVIVKSDQQHDGHHRRRTEFRPRDQKSTSQVPVREPYRVLRRYGISLRIPKGWPITDDKFLWTQWHATADKAAGEPDQSPPLDLQIRNGRVKLVQRTTDVKVTSSAPPAVDLVEGPTDGNGAPIPLASLIDTWRRFVLCVVWDWRKVGKDYGDGLQSKGEMQLYLDGKLIFEQKGPNCYRDTLGPYWNFGMYSPGWADMENPAPGQVRKLMIRDVRVGGENSKLEDVL